MVAMGSTPAGKNLNLASDINVKIHLDNGVTGLDRIGHAGIHIKHCKGPVNHMVNAFAEGK